MSEETPAPAPAPREVMDQIVGEISSGSGRSSLTSREISIGSMTDPENMPEILSEIQKQLGCEGQKYLQEQSAYVLVRNAGVSYVYVHRQVTGE